MKFLVDLYRYLIIGLFGVMIITATYLTASGLDGGLLSDFFGPAWMAIVIIVFISMIISFGGIAILIATHDRHNELVQEASRIADSLERMEYFQSESSDG